MMEKVKGIEITLKFLKNLIKVSDIIYYEGPLLSHYRSLSGEDYLFYWVDKDNKFNRWLIFNIRTEKLQDYLNKKISLYKLITELDTGFIYKVDIDNDLNYNSTELLYIKELPNTYLPSKESIYNFEPLDEHIDLSNISIKTISKLKQLFKK